MAQRIPRSAAQGAVVPVTDVEGVTQWQRWSYGELVSHIRQDLVVDASVDTTAGSVLNALQSGPHSSTTLWPPARAHRVAAMTLSAGFTIVSLDTVDFGSGFSGGNFVCPNTGYYLTIVNMSLSTTATLTAQVAPTHNGTVVGALDGEPVTAGQAMDPVAAASDIVQCKAGDTLGMTIWISTGTLAIAGQGSPGANALTVVQVG